MGRPRDAFAWAQVQVLENGKWQCKYCSQVFKGAAMRIRNHLSGGSNDTSACPDVPEEIRNQALNKITRKRGRENISSLVQPLEISSSVTVKEEHVTTSTEEQVRPLGIEHITEAFMKWLLLTSATADVTKDSCLKEFFTRAQVFGVPSSLVEGDSTVLRNSESKVMAELNGYLDMVRESWKTTGCTLMVFNGNLLSKLKEDMCVIGLYCPKGIIFVEAPHPDIDFEVFRRALKGHEPSLDLDDSTTNLILHHDWTHQYHAESLQCLRCETQEICIDTCWESEWARGLIDKAVEYHEQICGVPSLRPGYYAILEDNVNFFKGFNNTKRMPAFNLSIFLSIMRQRNVLEQQLANWRNLLGQDVAQTLAEVCGDSQFWDVGGELYHVLAYILEVSEQMEALVPTSGYLAMAIERVTNRLNADDKEQNLSLSGDLLVFWKKIESKLRGTIEGSCREAASYLNPVYYVQQLQGIQNDDLQLQLQFQEKVKKALIKYIFTDFNRAKKLLDLGNQYGGQFVDEDGDWGNFVAEVQLYGHVTKSLLDKHVLQPLRHPLKLWEEFGDGLPILRRCAIRLLSQPVTCMCKQVKKLMLDVKGADDYILRLNLRMMHEFKMLGDGIYKPLDFSEWINRSLQGRIPEERAVTIRSSKAPAVQNDASEQSPKGTGPPNKFDMNMERRQGKKDTVRPRNEFAWSHVTMIEGSNKWKCNYCPKEYAEQTSASRIITHLSGHGGGISHCQGVPPEVRLEALMYKSNKTRVGELAPTGSTLPRINEEAIDSPDQPDHNPIDATPEDMEEDNVSGHGRAFPQPGQYEEPAVTSKAPRRSTKRVRISSSASSANIDASSNLPLSIATWSSGHEHVKDAFVKLQMCINNVPPMRSDIAMDPLFREFVESVGKHGVPSSLLGVDSLDALQELVLRIKHEVDRNMLMLKESWETTGCTLMTFDLTKHFKKEEFDWSKGCYMKDKIVIAIYCTKGIIFMEAPADDDDYDYEDALRRHSPSLYTDERVHCLRHDPYDHDSYKICELNHIDDNNIYRGDGNEVDHICLRSEIQILCSRSYLDSYWARSLLDVAVGIHERLCFLGDPWYYGIISTEKVFSLDVSLFEKEASRLPIFLLIIQNDPEGHRRMKQPDIEAITKGSKFWNDGQQLAVILNSVLRFADVMDTLVPTSGYFDMALDRVKNTMESCGLQLGEDALQFWEELKSKIEVIANTKIFLSGSNRLACSYLNPLYFVKQLQKDPLLPTNELKEALKDEVLVEILGGDEDKIDEEVERYGQVFSKLSKSIQLEDYHPVKLWEEHGSDLPVLRRCALELLSRPLSCVCKQVKEHLYQLQGADDYILRLNFRMMRHFQIMGDDIYQPISLFELNRWNFTKYLDCNSSSSRDSDDHGGLKKAQSRVIDPPPPPPVSSNAPISFPYIDVIPMSMRTHVRSYRDVKPDGNCGYRAIAQAFGLGQHNWAHIRRKMIEKLNQYQSLIQETFTTYTVDSMLLALDYFGGDSAPEDKWFSLPDMGCLVATALNCAFVVLGGTNQTFLPVYLTEGQTNNLNIETVCICLLTKHRHFISVSLSEDSPLPPLYHIWRHHHHESADLLIDRFGLRLKEYMTASNVNRDHESMIV